MGWSDKEKEKAYNKRYLASGMWKKWYSKNRKRERARRRTYYAKNTKKCIEYKKEWLKKNPWFKHFWAAKQRCVRKGSPYNRKGIRFSIALEEVKEIWFRDKAFKLKNPSIDRKNSKGNYTFKNCRFIDRWENARQGLVNRYKK